LASVSDTSAHPDNDGPIAPNAASPAQLLATIDVSSTDQTASGKPLWGISIQTLHATRERPLFSPSRRPAMPAAIRPPVAPVKIAAPLPPPPAPTLDLLGIVEGNGEAYAVFINTTTHDTVRLKTEEAEDGWVLRSVIGRKAVVEKDDHAEVLKLPPLTGVQK
jgi:general secretion pathway protein N